MTQNSCMHDCINVTCEEKKRNTTTFVDTELAVDKVHDRQKDHDLFFKIRKEKGQRRTIDVRAFAKRERKKESHKEST